MTKEQDVTYCNGCHCATKSIRKSRAYFVCGKCGHDKTLGDVYQYELQERIGRRNKDG